MKTTVHITDLITDLCPDELGMDLDEAPVTADRVMDILQERGVLNAPRLRKRRGLCLVTRIAVAAALTLALSVTAYAVYQARMADYLFPETAAMSMVGYQGTPEYEAFLEWTDWQEEHPYTQYLAADGSDDNADYAYPDYHPLYGAWYTEQGQALDAIMEKYGLTPHHSSAFFGSVEQLYEILDAEPFMSEAATGGGYVYDDGAFKLEADQPVGSDTVTYTLFTSVKGSFSDIYASAIENGQEWVYTTANGVALDLILGDNNSMILAETENTYIHVGVWCGSKNDRETWFSTGVTPFDRVGLEAFAETIDFAALARVFDGKALDLTEAIAEANTQRQQVMEQMNARLEAEEAENARISQEVVAKLGRYELSQLPEGFFAAGEMFGLQEDGSASVFEVFVPGLMDVVRRGYMKEDEDSLGSLYLEYRRSHDHGVTNAEQFESAKAFYSEQDGFMEVQVNGCQGFYYPSVEWENVTDDSYEYSSRRAGVMWLDIENDLLFSLEMFGGSRLNEREGELTVFDDPFIPAELIALAETMVKVG